MTEEDETKDRLNILIGDELEFWGDPFKLYA